VRIYLYTYVLLLFPAGNYPNPILHFRPDFDDFNGASDPECRSKIIFQQLRQDPSLRVKTGEKKFSQYTSTEVKNRCS
jgi:hypothetical protein